MSSVVGNIGTVGQLGLQALENEPIRLKKESDRCSEELEALVMQNYRVFIENLTVSVELRMEDQKLGKYYNDLSGNLQQLSVQCADFKEKVSLFINSHKRNRKTLQHHMQLVELLEVPQLVDACARNGFHDEALELANFVNGLERRHLLAEGLKARADGDREGGWEALRKGSIVIQSIVGDVHATLMSLRRQLIAQIAEEISLPKELQALTTIRKLDTLFLDRQLSVERFNNPVVEGLSDSQRDELRSFFLRNAETRLQMEYLEARTLWMRRIREGGSSPLSKAPSSGSQDKTNSHSTPDMDDTASFGYLQGPYPQAIGLMDVHRGAWFIIVTEFRALFNATSAPSSLKVEKDNTKTNEHDANDNAGNNGAPGSTGLLNWRSAKAASTVPAVSDVASALTNKSANISSDYSNTAMSSVAILTAWFQTQLYELLQQLEGLCLRMEDGNAFRATMEQAFFFAQRMGEVGYDFTSLLMPIFRNVVLLRVSKNWTRSVEDFKSMLSTERYSSGMPSSMQVVPLYLQQQQSDAPDGDSESDKEAQALKTPTKGTASMGTLTETSGSSQSRATEILAGTELPPPLALTQAPPLTFLANALLIQLNFVRESALSSVQPAVQDMVGHVLSHVSSHLIAEKTILDARGTKYLASSDVGMKNIGNKSRSSSSHRSGNNEIAESMSSIYVRLFAHDLVPHILGCVDCLYQNTNLAIKAIAEAEIATAAAADANASADMVKRSEEGRVPSPQEVRSHLKLGGLHTERLMDAETVLSSASYVQLQAIWSPLIQAGLLYDKPLTPSPLPAAKRAQNKGADPSQTSQTGVSSMAALE